MAVDLTLHILVVSAYIPILPGFLKPESHHIVLSKAIHYTKPSQVNMFADIFGRVEN
jgi:hypothetical protein